jgi:hypothetical protein
MTEALAIVLGYLLGAIRKSGMAALGVDRWRRNKKDG